MFSKKCMVVGSLLVMAAQTATAVQCSSVTDSGALATMCGHGYTGALISPETGDCGDACDSGDATTCCVPAANCNTITSDTVPSLATVCDDTALYVQAVKGGDNYCAGTACADTTADAATCCATRAPCSSITTDLATICGYQETGPGTVVGYTGAKIGSPGTVKCTGATCDTNDRAACCEPAALCSSITAADLCTDTAVYVQALIGGAFCAGDACVTSGNTDPDETRCCVAKANCDTIIASTPAATFCAGDAYTGALKPNDAQNRCAGATCQRTDSFTGDADTCCVQLVKAKCSSISDVQTNCPAPGYTGLNGDKTNSECAGVTCGPGDASTCCTAAVTCTSDYKDDDDMVASGAGTASGASITFTCDSGYAATENGVATCQDDGTWSGGKCEKVTPTCSVTDGSKATPWTGGTAAMEECTCTGAAKKCSTLNVCDVAKKTCVCTPGKDHWCYESAERSFAVKFGCFKEGENKFKGWKCVGDNVLQAKYSDATCDTQITPANDGEDTTFSATKMTEVKKEGGTLKTTVDTTTTGISTCKGGVPGAGAGAAAPGPAPGAAAPGPSGDAEFDAGSVAQCSTLAMLMVVAAMWAGRN